MVHMVDGEGMDAGLPALSSTGRDVFFYGEPAGAAAGFAGAACECIARGGACDATRAVVSYRCLVVLPDHMHYVWTLPPGDDDYSNRWKAIKIRFVQALPRTERRSKVRIGKGERGIWQRRFWEHAIRDETDYVRHIDYVHWNPAKHGYVQRVTDWPYSSFHR